MVDGEGRCAGAGVRGELCFSGPLIMKGYAGDPGATSHAIDADNWLHTGDVGYYDRDGYFYVVDRLKELIKYKGYQVGINPLMRDECPATQCLASARFRRRLIGFFQRFKDSSRHGPPSAKRSPEFPTMLSLITPFTSRCTRADL